jgi:hypothetical protein
MVRRLIATALAVTFVGGCSTPSPTPGPSDAAPPSAAASPSESPTGHDSGPPNPLDLQPTLDASRSATALIGWEGGTIQAIGPDGTTYTLEVQPEALAFPTTITMTPLSDLDGFGLDPAPEHVLGVELEPEGLQMVVPARLTMATGAAVPEAGVATGDYLGNGQDAGLVLTDFTDAGITFEVSHFSGFWTVWPIHWETWRVVVHYRQRAVERQFENELALLTGIDRQKQLSGLETGDLWDQVRGAAKRFEREVLNPRRGQAGLGCAEAELALAAYVAYDRTLQLLGVVADESSTAEVRALYEELKRPIPRSLLDFAWNLCLNEEYQRCAAVGEFPRLAGFLLAQADQRDNAGYPLTPEQLLEGQNRLERCGHWRVRLNTTEDLLLPGGVGGWVQEWTIEIDVRFRAGGPPFGLVGARIDGEGEIQVTKLKATLQGEPDATLRNIHTSVKPQARINGMTFDTPSFRQEPVARSLSLWVNPGEVSWEALHRSGFHAGQYMPYTSDWAPSSQAIFGAYPPTIAAGWHFLTRPYRALFGRDGNSRLQGVSLHSWIEVIVEHTPD